ncbi:MAG: hypothetical protein CVV27_09320 [Candidatus Melainabacteria bacterium HGW-Melainabacteria-1]|nr:MAG: hypothetical protein CVV27_09320 [Candidatus Melainabacteria bacterium HGW-Melainabacteria-1]
MRHLHHCFSLLLAVSCLLSAPVQAQPDINLDVWQGAKLYYQPGFSFLDTGPLNQVLAPNTYANHSGTFLSQGGGGQILLDRIVIGAAGYSLNGFRSSSAGGDTLSVSAGHGLFQLGYVLVREEGLTVYPLLGIGSGSVRLRSSGALNKLFGFNSSADVFEMQSAQVVLDLGLGADYLLDFNGDPEHASGLLVGLKLGYVFIPSPPQWEAGGRPIGGAVPNLNAQGPYLSLTLGLGTQRQ